MTAIADRSDIQSLEPKLVWRYFSGIASIPRPSKHEEKIRAHVKRLAESLSFAVREDHVGNLLIEVPATKRYENKPPTVLQGHLDMVCEKNAGITHNFDTDPIRLVRSTVKGKDIIHADGTTLGADNGIGVALALAVATDPDAVHGPLEILCTIDEETGMTGAKNIAPDFFKGRRMINLDSEEDDAIYIGCAGGTDTTFQWSLPLSAPPSVAEGWRISVSGLKGGHSGCDIHLNRGSAIALLAQALSTLNAPTLQLAAISGGSKRNAIPREASATVVGSSDVLSRLRNVASAIQSEAIANGESNCTVMVDAVSASLAASPQDSWRVLAALAALPHGVLAVVPDIPGLVQTSNGTTIATSAVKGGDLHIEIGCLSRSSSKSDLAATLRKLAAVGSLAGARTEHGNEYPGWAPNSKSPTLAACRRTYERVFGHAPRIASIHAGLECGIIGERVGGMDMVSFGPNIHGAHSPDECVEVASVNMMYRYLLGVLKDLASGV